MTRHIKAEVRVTSRNDIATEFLDPGIEVWSNGRPEKTIQLRVGEYALVIDAEELIDALQRCSKRDEHEDHRRR